MRKGVTPSGENDYQGASGVISDDSYLSGVAWRHTAKTKCGSIGQ